MWLNLLYVLGGLAFLGLILIRIRDSDIFLTSPLEGTVRAAVKGNELVRFIPNIQGVNVDRKTGKVLSVGTGVVQELPWYDKILIRLIGARWLGLYPITKLYEFDLESIARLKDHIAEDAGVETWIEYQPHKLVRELRWKFPRPMLAPDVTLPGDKADVKVVLNYTLQVTDFYKAIFEYGGKFFPPADTVVDGAINDFVTTDPNLTWDLFSKLPKGSAGSTTSLIGKTKELADAQLSEFGLQMVEGYLKDYSLAKNSEKIQEANRAKEIAEKEGDAAIAKAEKEGDAAIAKAKREGDAGIERAKRDKKALTLVGEGQANYWTAGADTYARRGGNPDILLAVRGQKEKAAELKSLTGTYVEGGGVQVALQIDGTKKVLGGKS